MNTKQMSNLFAEYWRVRKAVKAAQALVTDLGCLASRKTCEVAKANAERWNAELRRISAVIEAQSNGEVIVDGSLPAPEIVPQNVVPFREYDGITEY